MNHDPSDMPTHTPRRLRGLRRLFAIHDEATLPPGRPPRTTWAHPPGWCYPGEQVYASSPCHAWSTRPHTDGSPLLDHGQGLVFISNLQTAVFLHSPGETLCVPHWMVAETGVHHGDLELAMMGSLVRLRLSSAAHTLQYQHLIDELRHAPAHLG
ncbi:hypothetical protein FF36_05586 [Frankia torreyi]|uniref:Uncharacterized protein n=1 Tax=Frankia torreyi TaxID=1856 RepID=A0A0D8B7K7_9ACTN|nr:MULTISPECIES: hypothetical protein [Frankia]KJE20095.1 hypothetical protein FF36_05586 [Frankia torreyi]